MFRLEINSRLGKGYVVKIATGLLGCQKLFFCNRLSIAVDLPVINPR